MHCFSNVLASSKDFSFTYFSSQKVTQRKYFLPYLQRFSYHYNSSHRLRTSRPWPNCHRLLEIHSHPRILQPDYSQCRLVAFHRFCEHQRRGLGRYFGPTVQVGFTNSSSMDRSVGVFLLCKPFVHGIVDQSGDGSACRFSMVAYNFGFPCCI